MTAGFLGDVAADADRSGGRRRRRVQHVHHPLRFHNPEIVNQIAVRLHRLRTHASAPTLEIGADELEFEYEGRDLWVTAFRGPTGLGIGSVESNSDESRQLIASIEALRRRKTVKVDQTICRVSVSRYESFGEWAWRVKLSAPRTTKG